MELYFLFIIVLLVFVFFLLRSRNMHYWIASYVCHSLSRFYQKPIEKRHVYFCLADHFEPFWRTDDKDVALQRVIKWYEQYPLAANKHQDSFGNSPQHSFFYPEEEYDERVFDVLTMLCHQGYGDVEIHLHHDNDTAENLANKLSGFKALLHEKHGFLKRDRKTSDIMYAFIHGNWALDNSHPKGAWCGVNNEIDVLVKTGCYMDMTMPSAPDKTQTKKINSIYFAKGVPNRRKSHDTGRDVTVGEPWKSSDELLMVQGPLTLNWSNRKFGILPKIESADISSDNPPTKERVKLWFKSDVCVKGAEEHVFIKAHTHGAQDDTSDMLFSGGFDVLWSALESEFIHDRCSLHYVTARQMYEKIEMLANG